MGIINFIGLKSNLNHCGGKKNMERRSFIEFLAWSSLLGGSGILTSCAKLSSKTFAAENFLTANDIDDLYLARGLDFSFLIKESAVINNKGEKFGANSDFIAVIPISDSESYLWVNHESFHPLFVSGWNFTGPRLLADVDKERKVVGGSLLKIIKKNNSWEIDLHSLINARFDGTTKIPFANNVIVAGSKVAEGTLANCAGGVTPWGTFLTCEENFHQFYGDSDRANKQISGLYQWQKFYNNSSLHYGWVVEIDPKTKKAKKHTSLGRFAHECATCMTLPDGRTVVYSGDDNDDQFLYKFMASEKNSLDKGELFVADFDKNEWISLDLNKNKILKEKFSNQLEVLCYCREAGTLVGATPLARPEDIEIHPKTGEIFISLTNNSARKNYHGAIRKLKEIDHMSGKFTWEEFVVGGTDSGISCPDNLVFDKNGNLWVTNDIAGKNMNHGEYKTFKNNGLYFIPTSGTSAGKVFQIASAPHGAELTGPCFSPDHKELFLSVQHPGENATDLQNLTSNWPNKKNELPQSCVVKISGPLLDQLLSSDLKRS